MGMMFVDNFNGDVVVFFEDENTYEILWRGKVEFFLSERGREEVIKNIEQKGFSVPEYWKHSRYLLESIGLHD